MLGGIAGPEQDPCFTRWEARFCRRQFVHPHRHIPVKSETISHYLSDPQGMSHRAVSGSMTAVLTIGMTTPSMLRGYSHGFREA